MQVSLLLEYTSGASANIHIFTVSRFAHAHLEGKQAHEVNDEDSFSLCVICDWGGRHGMVASCCAVLSGCESCDRDE
jgi:hypothetical protein